MVECQLSLASLDPGHVERDWAGDIGLAIDRPHDPLDSGLVQSQAGGQLLDGRIVGLAQ